MNCEPIYGRQAVSLLKELQHKGLPLCYKIFRPYGTQAYRFLRGSDF